MLSRGIAVLTASAVLGLAAPTVDFGLVFPTGGTISYAGGGGVLTGSGIAVSNVAGAGTPLNNGVLAGCTSCVLSFSTGSLLSQSGGIYTFAGGGTLTITGSVNGVTGPTTLLSATFASSSPVVVTNSAAGFTLGAVFGAFSGILDSALAAFFGLPGAPYNYAGGLNLSFLAGSTANGGFSTASGGTVLSGDVFASTPEPGSILLLSTGLLLSGALLRRRLSGQS